MNCPVKILSIVPLTKHPLIGPDAVKVLNAFAVLLTIAFQHS